MSLSVIAFVMSIFLYISASVVIWNITGEKIGFIQKKSKLICTVGFLISALLFIIDIVIARDVCGYLTFADMMIFAAAGLMEKKRVEKYRKIFNFSIRLVVICTALELFVFNINALHLISGQYEAKELDISSAELQNFDLGSRTNESGGNSVIEFKGINVPVGTIRFDVVSDKKSKVELSVDISDDTNSASYRWGAAKANVIKDNLRSHTVPCNFSGKVHDLRISFNTDDDEKVILSKITINTPVMLHFSIIRFIIMIGAGFIVYSLISPEIFYRKYSEVQKSAEIAAKVFTVLLVLLSLFVTNMARYKESDHSISKDFGSTWGNQITMELVESFENGRVDIMTDMNEKLLELENPYDWSQRNDEVGSYPWDHLLYNGKYYSYYGIAPVLTVFLPYHKLTGYYFPSCWAVFLFGAFGIIFLTKFWLSLAEKFFKNTYASLILGGLVIMQLSTGIILCNISPLFYEIAQSSGFLCTVAGAYFLMSSNVIGEGKIIRWRVAVSGIWLSLGVLCRPTIAVYCMAAMILLFAGFRKNNYLSDKKQGFSYLACALVPYIVIGSVQIWYNYARFGNPFDFGIQYSLTINDFTASQYHTHFAAVGFWGFLFQLPVFTETFPFFRAERIQLFTPQGYYFVATGAALGLIWKALPVAAYGKALHAYRYSQDKNKFLYSVIIAVVCLICPFAVIFSIWESGFSARYSVDFAWQMITGAMIICFIIHNSCRENTKIHLNKLLVASVGLSVVMNTAQLWSYINPAEQFSTEWQAKALSFARLFEFWI